jgi:hypothetical protein
MEHMTCTLGQSYDSSGNYVGNSPSGWTSFAPSADTHIFYVASDGNNATARVDDPSRPFADPWYIFSNHLLRKGFPDWMLFRKGDSWPDGFGTLPGDCSGRSATEPMVFGSYDGGNPGAGVNPASGGARPLFNVEPGDRFKIAATDGGGWSAGSGNYLVFVGLDFYAYKRDPSNAAYDYNCEYAGMAFFNPIEFLLIEDCKFSFFQGMIYFEGHYAAPVGHQNCRVRRSVIVDAWQIPYNVQGMYTNLSEVMLEENVLDHNGWNETNGTGYGSVFNHNFYLQGIDGADTSVVPSGDVALPSVIRGNIISYDCTGSQVRGGGTVWDNSCIHNPYSHNIGCPDYKKTDRVNTIAWNVYLEGCDAPGGEAYGWGVMNFTHYDGDNQNYNYGTLIVDHNIVCHTATRSGNGFGMYFSGMPDGITISNNIIYDWQKPYLQPDATCTFINNDTSDDASHFPHPDRSVGSYFATLGLGGGVQTTDFLKAARGQSKANWNPALTANALNNYIREGFGMSGLGGTPPPVQITIAPPTLPAGTVGTAYNQTVTASGGTAPYQYSSTGQLPAGLTLSSAGVISGAPTAAGASSFAIKATDSASASATQSYSITIAASQPVPGAIVISPSTLPGGTVGVSYSQIITATGGTPPYGYAFTGALPPGLALSTGGTLSGTPTAVATSSFTIKVTDTASGSATQAYTIAIVAGAVSVPVSGVVAIAMGTATAEKRPPQRPPTIQSVNVSGTITVGADQYQWQGPATDAGGGNYNFSATATKAAAYQQRVRRGKPE